MSEPSRIGPRIDIPSMTRPSRPATDALPEVRSGSGSGSVAGFAELLAEGIQGTNDKLQQASDLQERYIAGEDIDLHEVTIAAEEAALALELLVQLRNKVVDGVNDLLHNTLTG